MGKMLAVFLLASVGSLAHAAHVTCEINRVSKYNTSNIRTHFVRLPLEGMGILPWGEIPSFLIPTDARVKVGVQIINRNWDNRISLETRSRSNLSLVDFDESYGSVYSSPRIVKNEFQAGAFDYTVECWVAD